MRLFYNKTRITLQFISLQLQLKQPWQGDTLQYDDEIYLGAMN